jgi:hypothetical protein
LSSFLAESSQDLARPGLIAADFIHSLLASASNSTGPSSNAKSFTNGDRSAKIYTFSANHVGADSEGIPLPSAMGPVTNRPSPLGLGKQCNAYRIQCISGNPDLSLVLATEEIQTVLTRRMPRLFGQAAAIGEPAAGAIAEAKGKEKRKSSRKAKGTEDETSVTAAAAAAIVAEEEAATGESSACTVGHRL